MKTSRQWGCVDLDFIIFTAIISCALFLHPLFALGLPAVALHRPAPAVQHQRRYRPVRSVTGLRLPLERLVVDHHTRKAA